MTAGRILLIQTAPLGDFVLTLPLLRAVVEKAGARAVCVVRPGLRALAAAQPGVERALAWRKRGLGGAGGEEGWSERDLARALRAERFDAALLVHRSFRSARLAWRARVPRRIGFAGGPGSWVCGMRLPRRGDVHATRRLLELARGLGLDPESLDPTPRLRLPAGAAEVARALLDRAGLFAGRPFGAVAPGAAWGTKRWPEKRWAAFVARRAESGEAVVLVGTGQEAALCARVAGGRAEVANLAGRTDLPALAAVLAQARWFAGGDSGAGHVAAACGTPTATLFGPTVPAMGFAPRGPAVTRVVEIAGLDCRPCHRHGPETCPLGHHRCLSDLPVERLETEIAALERAGTEKHPSGRDRDQAGPSADASISPSSWAIM